MNERSCRVMAEHCSADIGAAARPASCGAFIAPLGEDPTSALDDLFAQLVVAMEVVNLDHPRPRFFAFRNRLAVDQLLDRLRVAMPVTAAKDEGRRHGHPARRWV